MPSRRDCLFGLALAATGVAARAQARPVPAEVAAALPGAWLQGEGRLRFFGLRVYEARLWTGGSAVAAANWSETPFALELEYARSLVGRLIAERSIEEMRRQRALTEAEATRWLEAMTGLFPDVKEGDRLTGLHRPGQGARFVFNGQARGEVAEPAFARLFFGIWLSEQTSEPALRDALLGR